MKTVRYLGIDYPLREFRTDIPIEPKLNGLYDPTQCAIYMDFSLPRGLYRQTLLHELIHMISDRGEISLGETKVRQLAAGLLGVEVDGRGIVRL